MATLVSAAVAGQLKAEANSVPRELAPAPEVLVLVLEVVAAPLQVAVLPRVVAAQAVQVVAVQVVAVLGSAAVRGARQRRPGVADWQRVRARELEVAARSSPAAKVQAAADAWVAEVAAGEPVGCPTAHAWVAAVRLAARARVAAARVAVAPRDRQHRHSRRPE